MSYSIGEFVCIQSDAVQDYITHSSEIGIDSTWVHQRLIILDIKSYDRQRENGSVFQDVLVEPACGGSPIWIPDDCLVRSDNQTQNSVVSMLPRGTQYKYGINESVCWLPDASSKWIVLKHGVTPDGIPKYYIQHTSTDSIWVNEPELEPWDDTAQKFYPGEWVSWKSLPNKSFIVLKYDRDSVYYIVGSGFDQTRWAAVEDDLTACSPDELIRTVADERRSVGDRVCLRARWSKYSPPLHSVGTVIEIGHSTNYNCIVRFDCDGVERGINLRDLVIDNNKTKEDEDTMSYEADEECDEDYEEEEDGCPSESSNTLAKLIGNPKKDGTKASYNIVGKQFLKGVKEPLIAKIVDAWGGNKKERSNLVDRLGQFFDTDVGEAVLAYVCAAGLNLMPFPTMQKERGHVATSLREGGLTNVGMVVAEVFMAPLRDALTTAMVGVQLTETETEE